MLDARSLGKIILVAVGIAAAYWVFESIIMVTVFQEDSFLEQLRPPINHELWMRLTAAFILGALVVYWQVAIARLRKIATEREQALAQVKILRGLLPICANCKKIRDDTGYWNSIESYIDAHSEASFTHGICPECVRKLYPEITDKLPNQ